MVELKMLLLVLVMVVVKINADVYLHNPPWVLISTTKQFHSIWNEMQNILLIWRIGIYLHVKMEILEFSSLRGKSLEIPMLRN